MTQPGFRTFSLSSPVRTEDESGPEEGLNGAERLNGLHVSNRHFALQDFTLPLRVRRFDCGIRDQWLAVDTGQ